MSGPVQALEDSSKSSVEESMHLAAEESLKIAEDAWKREVDAHGPSIVLPMIKVGMRYLRNDLGEGYNKELVKKYDEALRRLHETFHESVDLLVEIARQGLINKCLDCDPPATVGQ